MKNTFKKEEDIEMVLKMIENDNTILNKLNVEQLELVDDYLKRYEDHLKTTKGEK